jgi:RHH-type transcriptional regulator, rel operon repressor / antitoxin RelB
MRDVLKDPALAPWDHLLYMYSNWSRPMLALRLPPEVEKRLAAIAKKTGRTKSFYAREAILTHLEDLEDLYQAQKALEEGGEPIPLDEMMKEYGLTGKK